MDILTYALLNKKVDNINEQIKDLTNEITLYKHRVNLTIIFDELPEVFTLEFLSKYNTPFINNGSLADMLVFYSSLNDTHAIINPMVILGNTYAIISQILPNGDTGIDISVVTNTTFVLNALYQDNASGITDTVTPYINFVGSAGGGSGKLYMYDFRAKLYDYNGNEVLNSEKQFRLGIYESNFERFKAQASQLGLTLNTSQDLVTLINNFDETTGTTDFNHMFLFLELIANADLKYFVYASTNTSYVEQINWNFFSGSLFTSIDSQEFPIADMNEGTEYYRGINTMNSCALIEYSTSGGGSGGGSSESNEGKIDYIEITSGPADTHFILTMPKGALDTQESITFFNNSISQLNSTFSVNIPAYSNINSLPTIATYINSLNDTTYLQLKSAFWTQMFFTINVSALSVKGCYLGHTSPIYIYAEPDTSLDNYGYRIAMLNASTMQFENIWTMSNTLNFNVFVNQLD